MPNVPRPEINNQLNAMPGVKFGSEAPAESFGGGASQQALNNQIGNLGETTTKLAIQSKNRADEAVTQSYDIKLSQEMNRLLWEPKKGALYTEGQNAFDIKNTYGTELNKFIEEADKGLNNDSQKGMAERIKQKYLGQFNNTLDQHTGKQMIAYEVDIAKNGVEASRENAILNYSQPGVVDQELKLQEAYIVSLGQKQGSSPEEIKINLLSAKSQTQSKIILRMLDDGKDMDADAYYETVKDQLAAGDVSNVKKALEVAKYRGASIRESDAIMKKTMDLGSSLAAARKIEDPKLRDETVSRVKERFQEMKAAEEYTYSDIFERADKMAYDAKSMDAIRPADLAQLKPEHIETIKKRVGGSFKTDYGVYTEVKNAIANEDPAILNMDPKMFYNKYRPHFDDTEYKEIVNDLNSLRSGSKSTKEKYDGYRTESQIVNDALNPIVKLNTKNSAEKEKISMFKKAFDEKVQQYKVENKKTFIPNDEAQKIADNLKKETIDPNSGLFGFFQKKTRRFEDKTRDKLTGEYKDAYDWALDNPGTEKAEAIMKKLKKVGAIK